MPLSKKRDRDRKRVERAVQPVSNLNSVQPTVSIPGLTMDGNRIVGVQTVPVAPPKPKRKRRDQMTPEEQGVTGYDADGHPLYED